VETQQIAISSLDIRCAFFSVVQPEIYQHGEVAGVVDEVGKGGEPLFKGRWEAVEDCDRGAI
jgi:hypothetical protein